MPHESNERLDPYGIPLLPLAARILLIFSNHKLQNIGIKQVTNITKIHSHLEFYKAPKSATSRLPFQMHPIISNTYYL